MKIRILRNKNGLGCCHIVEKPHQCCHILIHLRHRPADRLIQKDADARLDWEKYEPQKQVQIIHSTGQLHKQPDKNRRKNGRSLVWFPHFKQQPVSHGKTIAHHDTIAFVRICTNK